MIKLQRKNSTSPAKEDEVNEEEKDVSFLPVNVQDFFLTMGGLTKFTGQFFKNVFKPPFEFNEIFKQAYNLGFKSLFLVGLSAFIMGLVLTLQVKPTLVDFGAESFIPAMVTISIVREIGPVLTALICAGKIGSSIGAELGSMKVTEQIDAMLVSGTNPYNYIVVTRVLATTLMIPVLVMYADTVAMLGSFLGINLDGDVSLSLFTSQVLSAIDFSDLVPSFSKSVFFGFAIGIVGCYMGYNAGEGTVGVGKAANSSVVVASLFIFVIDLLAVQITQFFI